MGERPPLDQLKISRILGSTTEPAAPGLAGKVAQYLRKKGEAMAGCWCRKCLGPTPDRFIVCPACGNKRCPRASDHERPCTGSNVPGQPGSVYADAEHPDAKKP